jgi:hypothetical protein
MQPSSEPHDQVYVPKKTTRPLSSVDLRRAYPHLFSDIFNQGETNTCTANAVAAAVWYEQKRSERQPEFFGAAGPSRLFIYWLARGGYKADDHLFGFPCDNGASVQEAMRGIAACGACSDAIWPFSPSNINVVPFEEAFNLASLCEIKCPYRLDPDRVRSNKHHFSAEEKEVRGELVLTNLRKCLTEQHPVVFGLWYRLPASEAFDQQQVPWVLKDVWALPNLVFPRHAFMDDLPEALKIRNLYGEAISPAHIVLAIGYDDERQQILVQNSRGRRWGECGIFWMPYSWITDYAATFDFWTIRAS